LDLKEKTYPYTKQKFAFYIFIFILIILETTLDILYLSNISTKEPVMCCSVIFGSNAVGNKIPFNLSIFMLVGLFYLTFLLTIFSNIQKQKFINFIINTFFLYISYYAMTYFFSTYIYQLPTHQCPFCMLQKEYFFIGYFIWTSLFLGTFFGIASFVVPIFIKKDLDYSFKYSILFNSIFVCLCTFYLVKYYLINGVFLYSNLV
jgi:hypothetical protein